MSVKQLQPDFEIVQVLVYTDALSDDQIAGGNEWLVNNTAGTASVNATGLAITGISVSADLLTTTPTWSSKPRGIYGVDRFDFVARD